MRIKEKDAAVAAFIAECRAVVHAGQEVLWKRWNNAPDSPQETPEKRPRGWRHWPDLCLSFHVFVLGLTCGPLGSKSRRFDQTAGLVMAHIQEVRDTDPVAPMIKRAWALIKRYCSVENDKHGLPASRADALSLVADMDAFVAECERDLVTTPGAYDGSYLCAVITALKGMYLNAQHGLIFDAPTRREFADNVLRYASRVTGLMDSDLGKRISQALEHYCNLPLP